MLGDKQYNIYEGDSLTVLKTLPDDSVDRREVWKDVPSLVGICEVSNLGRVRSLDRLIRCYNGKSFRVEGKMKRLWKNKVTGYIYVTINERNYLVHRLIAETFLPNPGELPLVNHKDEDKTNNRVENLEWCTRQYNLAYSKVPQRVAEKCNRPIDVYDLDLHFINSFASRTEASKSLGVCLTCISACVKGQCTQAAGYIFVEKGVEPKPSVSDFRVKQIDIDSGETIAIYKSPMEAARILGYKSNDGIVSVCRDKKDEYKGFKWEYVSKIAKRGRMKKICGGKQ